MTIFFLTFLATAFAIIGGRDAVRVARLAVAHGSAGMLFAAAVIAACAYSALAAWLAGGLDTVLQGAAARLFIAIALAVAGFEVLLLKPGKAPAEPTRSLGATLLVLWAALQTGAAGFLVLAFAVMGRDPILAAAGGAAGAALGLGAALLAADDWDKLPLSTMRYIAGGALLLAALVTAFLAMSGG